MPIKRLKPSDEQELIAQIKIGLADYEEEYAPGAWEKFQKKENKKRGLIFWMGALSGAAALLLIGFAIFNYINKPTALPLDVLHAVNKPVVDNNTSVETKNSTPIIKRTSAEKLSKATGSQINIVSSIKIEQSIGSEIKPDDVENKVEQYTIGSPVVTKSSQEKPINTKPSSITLEQFLAKENSINQINQAKPEKHADLNKWDLGLVVAPSVGNSTKRLNMGYGMSMAYNLSKKVSLGSGVSYNEMTASKEFLQSGAADMPSGSAFANTSKNLESVNTVVSGIDIPLEIKYKLSERFYANAGLSAFAMISQKRSNTYQQARIVQESSISPSGDQQVQSYLVSEKVTETAASNDTKQTGIIGFYNFSFGYKQKVSKNKSIGIEPFLKVPMKDISTENLRLMGTGLKIKFDF